jgi:streptomycin 6-kinase
LGLALPASLEENTSHQSSRGPVARAVPVTVSQVDLPQSILSRVGAFGDAGAAWVARFPSLVKKIANNWHLTLADPFPNLSYHYVAPARQGNAQVVLKLGVPNPELDRESQALRAFAGRGVVRVLDADPQLGAVLLERLRPGTPLSELADDERAMAIAAESMTKLWGPAPHAHPFPTVAEWGSSLTQFGPEGSSALPERLVDRAQHSFALLTEASHEVVLLHGDFHQFNILDRGNGAWAAIDPKGAVGQRGFEVGPLIRNLLLDCDDPSSRLLRRVRRLSLELAMDAETLLRWAFARAVLSAVWLVEDSAPGLANTLRCARLIDEVLG